MANPKRKQVARGSRSAPAAEKSRTPRPAATSRETSSRETSSRETPSREKPSPETSSLGTSSPQRGTRPADRRVVAPPPVPRRPVHGHKGTFGHVLVLGGSVRYPGAPVLTARAVLRSGAGLVTIGCPKGAHATIASHAMCEMTVPLPDAPFGVFAEGAVSEALDRAERVQAVALGPGLSTEGPALEFARQIATLCPLPLVVDADGLNAFAASAQRLESCPAPRILTPHPGEAARMLGCTVNEVVEDRIGASVRLARETECIVCMKGAGTIVTDAERIYVNQSGNSGMATAGSGDVLTGVIAALLAQGMTSFDAAVLGVYLHGRAGDLAADRLGEHGLIATDILDALPLAFRDHAARSA